MIKKLQRKFIKIAMFSFFLVLLLIIGAINLMNFYQMAHRTDNILKILAENDGKFPGIEKEKKKPMKPNFMMEMGTHFTEETPYETRYFTVKLNEMREVEEINTSHIAAVSSKDAQEYALEVLKTGKVKGYQEQYKFLLVEKENTIILIFLDCHQELFMVGFVFFWSLIIMIISLTIVFLLLFIFSKKAIKPVTESIEKQKQFISDAGHEIKTPITIISANIDVMELLNGENEWILSIRHQIKRLTELVQGLLTMAKIEEQEKIEFSKFCINDMLKKEVDAFQVLARNEEKEIEINIDAEVWYIGEEKNIRQLINILLDNALKYSVPKSVIKITGKKQKKGVKLEIENMGEDIPIQDLDKLFDRFYRTDSSRARETGGYGIGLAMAKSIVERHKGKIWAECTDKKRIKFIVLL